MCDFVLLNNYYILTFFSRLEGPWSLADAYVAPATVEAIALGNDLEFEAAVARSEEEQKNDINLVARQRIVLAAAANARLQAQVQARRAFDEAEWEERAGGEGEGEEGQWHEVSVGVREARRPIPLSIVTQTTTGAIQVDGQPLTVPLRVQIDTQLDRQPLTGWSPGSSPASSPPPMVEEKF